MSLITKKGVKWIKVSKVDSKGVDRNDSWRINDTVTVTYPTGPTTYYVTNLVNAQNYWMLGVDYSPVTASNFGDRDYTFKGYLTGIQPSLIASEYWKGGLDFSNISVDNAAGWQKAQKEYYTLCQEPVDVDVSLSVINETGTAPATVIVHIAVDDVVVQSNSGVVSGMDPVVISVSATNVGFTQRITVYVQNTSTTQKVTPYVDSNSFLQIANTVSPSATSIVNLNPFVTAPFEGTDADVTYGWVEQYPKSQYYMDVDYSTGATIPTNQQGLITGSAQRAAVKDYYYALARHSNPRYKGVRSFALKPNEYTPQTQNANLGTEYGNYPITSYPGDKSYGKTSNVDVKSTYAARFQYIAGYTPERFNTLLLYVTDIIDEAGNVSQPKLGTPSYYNLSDFLRKGDTATVKILDSQFNTQFLTLNKTYEVIESGKRIETVLFTCTASISPTSSLDPLEGLAFAASNGTTLACQTNYSASFLNINSTTNFSYSSSIAMNVRDTVQFYKPNSRWIDNQGYKLQSGDSTPYRYSPLTFELAVYTNKVISNSDASYQVKLARSSTAPASYPQQVTTNYEVVRDLGIFSVPSTGFVNRIKTNDVILEEGYFYYWVVENITNTQIYRYSFNVVQSIPFQTSSPYSMTYSSSPYLLTSSIAKNQLTASNTLTSFYGKTQIDLVESGFNPPVPFTLQDGDEIRFLGDENRVHTIYNTQYNGSQLSFNIYPDLPSGSYDMRVVNSFSIRRYTDDPNIIIVKGDKMLGGTPGGVIVPTYTTDRLKQAITSNPLFTLQSGQSS